MKCGKCNIGKLKYNEKGIYFWYTCNNCDYETRKEVNTINKRLIKEKTYGT
jgi:hypothetical protein